MPKKALFPGARKSTDNCSQKALFSVFVCNCTESRSQNSAVNCTILGAIGVPEPHSTSASASYPWFRLVDHLDALVPNLQDTGRPPAVLHSHSHLVHSLAEKRGRKVSYFEEFPLYACMCVSGLCYIFL